MRLKHSVVTALQPGGYPCPIKFTDLINIHESPHDLILGLPYPAIFPYPVKAPICYVIWLNTTSGIHVTVDKVVTKDN